MRNVLFRTILELDENFVNIQMTQKANSFTYYNNIGDHVYIMLWMYGISERNHFISNSIKLCTTRCESDGLNDNKVV